MNISPNREGAKAQAKTAVEYRELTVRVIMVIVTE